MLSRPLLDSPPAGRVRALAGVLSWDDPALSAWLCATCVLLAAVLPLLPWLFIARAVGILLLGPHMWVYGRRQRAALAEAQAKAAREAAAPEESPEQLAKRYVAAADPRERLEMLRAEMAKRDEAQQKEAKAAEDAARALPYAEHAERRYAYGGGQHLMLTVPGSRVTYRRFATAPDHLRSGCRPGGL